MSATSLQLFWRKVAIQPDGCWLWSGSTNGHGYGRLARSGKLHGAHRFAYEHFIGPIPNGLDLDHLCRVRLCVNPSHLEPVTRGENLLRGDTVNRAHHEGRECGFAGCFACHRRQVTS